MHRTGTGWSVLFWFFWLRIRNCSKVGSEGGGSVSPFRLVSGREVDDE